MPRVIVNLVDVVCYDPEDVAGARDELYVVGAVSDGEQTEGVATVPVGVGAGQTQALGVGGGVVFDKNVPADRVLKIALTAFDEDVAKDWSVQGKLVDEIATAVSGGLAAIPSPWTQGAGVILGFAFSATQALISLDGDDNLGQHAQAFPVWSLAAGDHPQQWQFSGEWGGGFLGFSKWSYSLRYTISVM